MISNYKDLIFWQRAHQVATLVIILCRKLPKERVADILISQAIRSAVSVGANIAEGVEDIRRKSTAGFYRLHWVQQTKLSIG